MKIPRWLRFGSPPDSHLTPEEVKAQTRRVALEAKVALERLKAEVDVVGRRDA